MIRNLLTTFLLLGAVILRGQDAHFSQFTNATMHLSPAAVGMMEDKARINLQYRNQWSTILGKDAAFKTLSATYEKRKDMKSTDFFGWGVGVWQDKAGALQHDEIKGAVSYARKMAGEGNRAHYLVGGGSMGFFRKSIDLSGREWISQHDGNGGYDPTRQGGTVLTNRRFLFDVSMGLGWYSTFGKNNHLMGGFALQHLNRPEVSFDNAVFQNLYIRSTFHLAGEFQMARFFSVAPSAMMMRQGPSTEYMMGGALKLILREPNRASAQLGVWLRTVNKLDGGTLNDAWVITGRLDWERYGLGFSYDVNTSLLKEINNANHSIELLLTYRIGGTYNQARVITPRFL
ncbi:MAG: PorP/SprF family type IX secretion system membrane protein [Saprospiraceae bacterium]|nr:PorP/SprF family type IX secretion system membrane protein [Saprospiraceae bacterium]